MEGATMPPLPAADQRAHVRPKPAQQAASASSQRNRPTRRPAARRCAAGQDRSIAPPSSASSAWATSACPSPSRRPRSASASSASSKTPKRVKKVNCGENYIGDVKDEELAEVVKQGQMRGGHRLQPGRRDGHHRHRRAHAADAQPAARSAVRRAASRARWPSTCGRASSSAWNRRPIPARRDEVMLADPGRERASRPSATSSWPIRPSASIRATPNSTPRTRTRWSAASGPSRTRSRSPSTQQTIEHGDVPVSSAPRRPRWSRSTRTRSGP